MFKVFNKSSGRKFGKTFSDDFKLSSLLRIFFLSHDKASFKENFYYEKRFQQKQHFLWNELIFNSLIFPHFDHSMMGKLIFHFTDFYSGNKFQYAFELKSPKCFCGLITKLLRDRTQKRIYWLFRKDSKLAKHFLSTRKGSFGIHLTENVLAFISITFQVVKLWNFIPHHHDGLAANLMSLGWVNSGFQRSIYFIAIRWNSSRWNTLNAIGAWKHSTYW